MNARWKLLADQFGEIGDVTVRRFQTGASISWAAFSDFGGPPCRQQFIILASEAGQLLGDTSIAPENRWYSEMCERHRKAVHVFRSGIGTERRNGTDHPILCEGSEIAKAAAVSQRLAMELAETFTKNAKPLTGAPQRVRGKAKQIRDREIAEAIKAEGRDPIEVARAYKLAAETVEKIARGAK